MYVAEGGNQEHIYMFLEGMLHMKLNLLTIDRRSLAVMSQ